MIVIDIGNTNIFIGIYIKTKLNKVSIFKTKNIVCQNTIQAMKSGFYWGYTSLINGIIEKIINEKNIYLS